MSDNLRDTIILVTMLVIILITILFSLANAKSCADKYDECCGNCYGSYKRSGYHTECYNKCYEKYDKCSTYEGGFYQGCFIEQIGFKTKQDNEKNQKAKQINRGRR